MDFNQSHASLTSHMPPWVTPGAIVIGVIQLLFIYLVIIQGYRYEYLVLNFMFVYNVAAEVYVTTRGQFNTSPKDKMVLAFWAFTAALCIVAVTVVDVSVSMRNHMPMHGKKMVIAGPNNQPILAANQNIVISMLRIALQTLKHCSWEDRIRIAASVTQLVLRLAEYVSRHVCKVDVCTILQNNLSAVPLLLAMLCLSKRIFRKFDPPLDTISCMFVGNFRREAVDIPLPSSDLWERCLTSTPPMTVRASKTFDIWSTDLRAVSGETMHFTMMEMRLPENVLANEHWYIPPVDFVILHFSVLEWASYNAVANVWIQFVERHIKKSRVILVGTNTATRNENHVTEAQGYELAYRARAISYFELIDYTPAKIGNLFLKIVDLTR